MQQSSTTETRPKKWTTTRASDERQHENYSSHFVENKLKRNQKNSTNTEFLQFFFEKFRQKLTDVQKDQSEKKRNFGALLSAPFVENKLKRN